MQATPTDYDEIALALLKTPILTSAAELLTVLHGKPVARSDLDRRNRASPRLQNVRRVAEWAHAQSMLARSQAAIAERDRKRVREARTARA